MSATREQAQEALNKARAKMRQGKKTNSAAGNGHEPQKEPLLWLDACKLDHDIFWLIDDIIPRCNMMMVFGLGGCGKTYLGTSLAMGIASKHWFEHEAESGVVLYCAFERPKDAEDRLAALRDKHGHIGLPLALEKLGGKRLNDEVARYIIERAKEAKKAAGDTPVRAIIIDTVSAALGGAREDDEGLGRLRQIGEFIHAETGATVIWIHHAGKGEGRGPRGHLALADGCMVWWHVEERECGDRVVHVDKANRGHSSCPLFSFKLVPFEAARDQRGKPIVLCELQATDLEAALASKIKNRFGKDRTPNDGLGSRQKKMLSQLRKLAKQHQNGVERDILRSAFLLDLNLKRENDGKEKLSPESGAAIFRQVLASLRERALVKEDGDTLRPAT